jgi:hypothetical protein
MGPLIVVRMQALDGSIGAEAESLQVIASGAVTELNRTQSVNHFTCCASSRLGGGADPVA